MEALKDKQYKTFARLSRYNNVPFYYNVNDNKYMCGTYIPLNDSTPFTYHIIKRNDTLDSLALYYYNNPTYFWIIADFNNIIDPYEALKVGERIKIPAFSLIEFKE